MKEIFICKICKKNFKKEGIYKKNKYTCKECQKKQLLLRNEFLSTPITGVFKCTNCKKYFKKENKYSYGRMNLCLECGKNRSREYTNKNKEKINKRISDRKKIDIVFKLKCNIRRRIHQVFTEKRCLKQSKTANILGCTFEEFKIYIESKFEPWMNWDNYGKYNGTFNYGWDLDHIIPLASAKTEEEVIKLNHYTNFQPLCSHINRDIKRDTIKD